MKLRKRTSFFNIYMRYYFFYLINMELLWIFFLIIAIITRDIKYRRLFLENNNYLQICIIFPFVVAIGTILIVVFEKKYVNLKCIEYISKKELYIKLSEIEDIMKQRNKKKIYADEKYIVFCENERKFKIWTMYIRWVVNEIDIYITEDKILIFGSIGEKRILNVN